MSLVTNMSLSFFKNNQPGPTRLVLALLTLTFIAPALPLSCQAQRPSLDAALEREYQARRTALSLLEAAGSPQPWAEVRDHALLSSESQTYGAVQTSVEPLLRLPLIVEGPSSFNPVFADQRLDQSFSRLIHGRFLSGAPGAWHKMLAQRYELNSGQNKLTFYLRAGLRWSDGQPLTVEDFRYSFENFYFNERALSPFYVPGISLSIEDDGAISFTSQIVRDLDSFILLVNLAPLPAHSYKKWAQLPNKGSLKTGTREFVEAWRFMSNDSAAQTMVYSGPYSIADWQPGAKLVLKKNPVFDVYKVSIEELSFTFFADVAAAQQAYDAGQLDMVPVSQERTAVYTLAFEQSPKLLVLLFRSDSLLASISLPLMPLVGNGKDLQMAASLPWSPEYGGQRTSQFVSYAQGKAQGAQPLQYPLRILVSPQRMQQWNALLRDGLLKGQQLQVREVQARELMLTIRFENDWDAALLLLDESKSAFGWSELLSDTARLPGAKASNQAWSLRWLEGLPLLPLSRTLTLWHSRFMLAINSSYPHYLGAGASLLELLPICVAIPNKLD